VERIAFLPTKAKDPEIAVLRLSNEEHKKLHAEPITYVNLNQVFKADVIHVDLQAHSRVGPRATEITAKSPTIEEAESWLVVTIHYPNCMCIATCIPSEVPAP